MGTRDEELADRIVELMCGAPLPVATAVIRGVNAWNGVGALALCTVPTVLIRSSLGDSPDAVRLRTIKPDLEIGITVGAGHFHQLEAPEQVTHGGTRGQPPSCRKRSIIAFTVRRARLTDR